MWRVLSLAAAAGLLLAMPSQADTLVDSAVRASNLLEQSKPAEALEQATAIRDTVWDAAPIVFTTATFVESAATGYGRYTPRENAIFRADEQINIYAEPVGYGYGRDGDLFQVDLDADIELHTPNGHILVRQESFARLSTSARSKVREFHISLSLSLSGLKAGEYLLVTRLKDVHSDKSGSFSLPFTIPAAEPKPKPDQN